ncbi:MAG: 4'-phosphopantetheinyl transferase superfamily protein [Chloroflexi bacterium]|nr:4'-phosphopantetheinyl transferase superfamily protein [Chloroflexota bacterium]
MELPVQWPNPPDDLELHTDEVHVWLVDRDQPADRVESLRQHLSADEVARAVRLHFAEHRDRFVVCRGMLRTVLGRYLKIAPGTVRFRYGPHGKPSLAGEWEGANLHFNVTHSEDLALIALTCGRLIGVDLEYVGRHMDVEAIADRYFSPREAAALRHLPADDRTGAFFTCWTRKEAYVKARGGGLSIPLSQFDVSLAPGEPAALLRTEWDAAETAQWRLLDVNVGPDYRAAVAVQGHDWQMTYWSAEE